jgi:8-amino-3,8-dideoxy-alpha-D-manno-octulosonate transaminase
VIDDDEKREVEAVLNTGVYFRFGFEGRRNGTWKAIEFENELQKFVGSQYCHVVSSGTSALVAALSALEVGEGHEVIVPTFTFVATVEAVLAVGATPVFCEVDETLGLQPRGLQRLISEKTRAVILTHMCGCVAHVTQILAICRAAQVSLIEDACQAFGSTLHGQHVGTLGDIGCFSFDYVKTITSAEGGGIVTNERSLFEKARRFSDHGHDYQGSFRGSDGHPEAGLNFRISELHAAVGLAQLRKIDRILLGQRLQKSLLAEAITPDKHWQWCDGCSGSVSNSSFLNILFSTSDRAKDFVAHWNESGTGQAFYWFINGWHYVNSWDHFFSDNKRGRSPRLDEQAATHSDQVISRLVSIPIMLSWSRSEIEQKREIFRAALSLE